MSYLAGVGFFDKAKDLAKSAADGAQKGAQAAKDGIDRSGVVDKAKGSIDAKLHPDPSPVPPSQDELAEQQAWLETVYRRGGMDPRTLLSTEEISQALGITVALEGRLAAGDDVAEARYRAADRTTGCDVYSFFAYDDDTEWVPKENYDFIADAFALGTDQTDGDEILGIGRAARLRDDSCVMLVHQQVIGISIHPSEGARTRALAEQLARLAATRVP